MIRAMLLTVSLIVAVGALGYVVYLAAGGTFGRELIKARLVILRSDVDVKLTTDGSGCSTIGRWEPSTRTCSLGRDLSAGEVIRVADDDIRLDGFHHTMRASADAGPAILIVDVDGVSVENLRITGYSEGILLQRSKASTLRNLTIDSIGGHAIRIMGDSRYNHILDNDLGPADWHGVALWWSHGNLIAGNSIVGTRDAVRLQSSVGNVIVYNRTMGSMIEGVDVHISAQNAVLLNDLVEPLAAPILDDAASMGTNVYDTRWGGNYVSRFDQELEGCVDRDSDGRCDGPYEFFKDRGTSFFVQSLTSTRSYASESDIAWDYAMERVIAVGAPELVCSGCHDLEGGVEVEIGPPLHGVLGREVGAYPGFEYSEALKDVQGVWNEEMLREFIRNPEAFAPGTTMTFPGIEDPDVREEIIQQLLGLR